MKLCINCKHNTNDLWCISPANGLSPVDGRPNPAFAGVARSDGFMGNCGPDAVNFEQKPPPPMYFFDESQRPHVTTTVSSLGFVHKVYQYFGSSPKK